MNLSLDDTLKLALACGYEDAYTVKDVKESAVLVPEQGIFNPTSPDTLMRLMTNPELRLSVKTDWNNPTGWLVYAEPEKYLIRCTTPEQIADGIIECSMAVLNNG